MRRREFIAGLGAMVWASTARAQAPMRRLGFLSSDAESDPAVQERIRAFRESLSAFGWTEGATLRIDYRWAGGNIERIGVYAQELVALQPDVIFAGAPTVPALQQTTRTIPIVFVGGADPVAEGLVASMARPGGNVTGFSANAPAIATKRLQLLREIAPQIARVGFIYDPLWPGAEAFLAELESVAPSSGVRISAAAVNSAAEIERAIGAFAGERNAGLVVYSAGSLNAHLDLIIGLASRHGLPAVYGFSHFVAAGGLISYGIDPNDPYRRAASYVDRILRGARATDLPAQQPTKFELVINLKTAKALDLIVPVTLLALADQVIE